MALSNFIGSTNIASFWRQQLASLLFVFAIVMSCAAQTKLLRDKTDDGEKERAQWLRGLKDKQILGEYERVGVAIQDTYSVPTDMDISIPLKNATANERFFASIRSEIITRQNIVPLLIEFLRAEVSKRREMSKDAVALPGFVRDSIVLLVSIRDPRAAKVFVEILDGFDGKATPHHRGSALDGLEQLTYVSFRHVRPFSRNYGDAVEHGQAVAESGRDLWPKAAVLYREWLDGEGKDATKWLDLARRRAKILLASDEPIAVFCAATFLRPITKRDNEPIKTWSRLAEVIEEFQPTDDPHYHTWNGKKMKIPTANWTFLRDRYGPMAKPKAK